MTARTLTGLVVVTLAVLIGAVIATRLPGGRADPMPDRLFEGLEGRVNDVASITLRSGERSLQLVRRGDEWLAATKGGYPVKFEEVKRTIMDAALLRPVEAKTANPAMYDRINVHEPGPDSGSKLLLLADADENPLASLIIGDSTSHGSAQRTYVRTSDAEQSWLVEGRLDPPVDPMRWIDREIIRLDRDRIRRVTVTRENTEIAGETYTLSRDDPSRSDFLLQDIPPGSEIAGQSTLNSIATAVTSMSMDDVLPRQEAPPDLNDAVIAEYETFDGLLLTVRTEETGGGEVWTSLHAAAAATAAGGGQDATEQLNGASEESDAQGEARRLNDRLGGWLYQIPQFKAASLRRPLLELLVEVDPQPEELGPVLDQFEGDESPPPMLPDEESS